MKLIALPAFTDNYIWMIHDGTRAVVVDPGESAPVMAALDAAGLTLAAILMTLRHVNHVGAIGILRGRLRGLVFGPPREHIPEPSVARTAAAVAQSARAHGAHTDEPVAVLADFRPWKHKFR
jgi:glyoxylase-like metal-dependent hydrolase (beta-lactamase superfamily II)